MNCDCKVLLLSACLLLACVDGRKVLEKQTAASSAAAAQAETTAVEAQKCLAGSQNTEVCSMNPTVAFSTSLGSSVSLPDRVYKQYMAQHVLCPGYTSQGTCTNKTGPVSCSWNPRKQRCEADQYASFLMPMTCPGSAARAYLHCMRKASEAACKADSACTPEHANACLPRTMISQAKQSNSSVQAVAEQLALGVLTGSSSAVGDCAEARTLQRMAELCPYKNSWNRCNHKYCTYDVPPYLPRRPQDTSQPAASTPAAARAAAATVTDVLTYNGYHPGPVCVIDTDKLPAVLHEILEVSKGLASVVTDAQKECRAAETVWLNVTANVAACGFDKVQYDAADVLQAAGIVQQQQQQQTANHTAAATAAAAAQKPSLQEATLASGSLMVNIPGLGLRVSGNLR